MRRLPTFTALWLQSQVCLARLRAVRRWLTMCVSHTFVLGPTQRGIESCAVDPVGRPLEPAFVVPLCRSFCETLTATCAEFLVPSGSGAFLPNCTDLIDGPAIVESPREGFVAVNCFNGSTDASSAANSTSLQCPSGL
jgi:hypothetical protein